MITLANVIEALSGTWIEGLDFEISRTVIDSREVEPGALFVALPGETLDGHDFVLDAIERGAAAALIDKALETDLPSLDLSGEIAGHRQACQHQEHQAVKQIGSPLEMPAVGEITQEKGRERYGQPVALPSAVMFKPSAAGSGSYDKDPYP